MRNIRGKYDLYVSSSSGVNIRIDVENSDGTGYRLSNFQAEMYIRPRPITNTIYSKYTNNVTGDGTGILIDMSSSGSFNILVSAASSSAWPFQTAYYTLDFISGSSIINLLEGKIYKDI